MGSLGVQEMLVIFLVALVLFGPKKLPELGRTIGKALTEFRRASNDLKATFDREMQALERETNELKDTGHQISSEIQSATTVDYSSLNPFVQEAEPSSIPSASLPAQEEHSSPAHDPSTVGASEVAGAESNGNSAQAAQATEPVPAIEGTIPRAPHPEPTPAVTAHADPQAGHTEAEVPQHS